MKEENDEFYAHIYDEANTVARIRTIKMLGTDYMKMPCGFAWIIIRPANLGFANWLKRTGKGNYDSYRKGVSIWISEYNQSADHKAIHAVMMAQILQINGIDAEAGTRLD